MEELNKEQFKIAEQVFANNDGCFITGFAGTGKSFLLKTLVKIYSDKYEPSAVAVTALTGIAAINIDGTTLHSFVGRGIDGKKRIYPEVAQRWFRTRVLFVDEVSMLTAEYLEMINNTLLELGISNLKIIFFGDFLQLPPVKGEFCFKSPVWDLLIKKTFLLETIVRQTDSEFIKVLGEIRIGEVSNESIEYLKQHCEGLDNNESSTKLHPFNNSVSVENMIELMKINEDEVELCGVDYFIESKKAQARNKIKAKQLLTREMDKIIPKVIKIKKGALIMLTRNSMENKKLVNGSRGTIVDFIGKIPLVQFEGLPSPIRITPIDFELDLMGYKIVRNQTPLKLAWSLTIHKIQGITVPSVNCTVEGSFECGQIYTGVSRTPTSEGLRIDSVDALMSYLKVSPEAKKFYEML